MRVPPSLAWPTPFLLGKGLVKCNRASCSGPHDNWGDRNAQMHYLTTLNAESAEQMALLHLTRPFPRRKETGHARLGATLLAQFHGELWNLTDLVVDFILVFDSGGHPIPKNLWSLNVPIDFVLIFTLASLPDPLPNKK